MHAARLKVCSSLRSFSCECAARSPCAEGEDDATVHGGFEPNAPVAGARRRSSSRAAAYARMAPDHRHDVPAAVCALPRRVEGLEARVRPRPAQTCSRSYQILRSAPLAQVHITENLRNI